MDLTPELHDRYADRLVNELEGIGVSGEQARQLAHSGIINQYGQEAFEHIKRDPSIIPEPGVRSHIRSKLASQTALAVKKGIQAGYLHPDVVNPVLSRMHNDTLPEAERQAAYVSLRSQLSYLHANGPYSLENARRTVGWQQEQIDRLKKTRTEVLEPLINNLNKRPGVGQVKIDDAITFVGNQPHVAVSYFDAQGNQRWTQNVAVLKTGEYMDDQGQVQERRQLYANGYAMLPVMTLDARGNQVVGYSTAEMDAGGNITDPNSFREVKGALAGNMAYQRASVQNILLGGGLPGHVAQIEVDEQGRDTFTKKPINDLKQRMTYASHRSRSSDDVVSRINFEEYLPPAAASTQNKYVVDTRIAHDVNFGAGGVPNYLDLNEVRKQIKEDPRYQVPDYARKWLYARNPDTNERYSAVASPRTIAGNIGYTRNSDMQTIKSVFDAPGGTIELNEFGQPMTMYDIKGIKSDLTKKSDPAKGLKSQQLGGRPMAEFYDRQTGQELPLTSSTRITTSYGNQGLTGYLMDAAVIHYGSLDTDGGVVVDPRLGVQRRASLDLYAGIEGETLDQLNKMAGNWLRTGRDTTLNPGTPKEITLGRGFDEAYINRIDTLNSQVGYVERGAPFDTDMSGTKAFATWNRSAREQYNADLVYNKINDPQAFAFSALNALATSRPEEYMTLMYAQFDKGIREKYLRGNEQLSNAEVSQMLSRPAWDRSLMQDYEGSVQWSGRNREVFRGAFEDLIANRTRVELHTRTVSQDMLPLFAPGEMLNKQHQAMQQNYFGSLLPSGLVQNVEYGQNNQAQITIRQAVTRLPLLTRPEAKIAGQGGTVNTQDLLALTRSVADNPAVHDRLSRFGAAGAQRKADVLYAAAINEGAGVEGMGADQYVVPGNAPYSSLEAFGNRFEEIKASGATNKLELQLQAYQEHILGGSNKFSVISTTLEGQRRGFFMPTPESIMGMVRDTDDDRASGEATSIIGALNESVLMALRSRKRGLSGGLDYNKIARGAVEAVSKLASREATRDSVIGRRGDAAAHLPVGGDPMMTAGLAGMSSHRYREYIKANLKELGHDLSEQDLTNLIKAKEHEFLGAVHQVGLVGALDAGILPVAPIFRSPHMTLKQASYTSIMSEGLSRRLGLSDMEFNEDQLMISPLDQFKQGGDFDKDTTTIGPAMVTLRDGKLVSIQRPTPHAEILAASLDPNHPAGQAGTWLEIQNTDYGGLTISGIANTIANKQNSATAAINVLGQGTQDTATAKAAMGQIFNMTFGMRAWYKTLGNNEAALTASENFRAYQYQTVLDTKPLDPAGAELLKLSNESLGTFFPDLKGKVDYTNLSSDRSVSNKLIQAFLVNKKENMTAQDIARLMVPVDQNSYEKTLIEVTRHVEDFRNGDSSASGKISQLLGSGVALGNSFASYFTGKMVLNQITKEVGQNFTTKEKQREYLPYDVATFFTKERFGSQQRADRYREIAAQAARLELAVGTGGLYGSGEMSATDLMDALYHNKEFFPTGEAGNEAIQRAAQLVHLKGSTFDDPLAKYAQRAVDLRNKVGKPTSKGVAWDFGKAPQDFGMPNVAEPTAPVDVIDFSNIRAAALNPNRLSDATRQRYREQIEESYKNLDFRDKLHELLPVRPEHPILGALSTGVHEIGHALVAEFLTPGSLEGISIGSERDAELSRKGAAIVTVTSDRKAQAKRLLAGVAAEMAVSGIESRALSHRSDIMTWALTTQLITDPIQLSQEHVDLFYESAQELSAVFARQIDQIKTAATTFFEQPWSKGQAFPTAFATALTGMQTKAPVEPMVMAADLPPDPGDWAEFSASFNAGMGAPPTQPGRMNVDRGQMMPRAPYSEESYARFHVPAYALTAEAAMETLLGAGEMGGVSLARAVGRTVLRVPFQSEKMGKSKSGAPIWQSDPSGFGHEIAAQVLGLKPGTMNGIARSKKQSLYFDPSGEKFTGGLNIGGVWVNGQAAWYDQENNSVWNLTFSDMSDPEDQVRHTRQLNAYMAGTGASSATTAFLDFETFANHLKGAGVSETEFAEHFTDGRKFKAWVGKNPDRRKKVISAMQAAYAATKNRKETTTAEPLVLAQAASELKPIVEQFAAAQGPASFYTTSHDGKSTVWDGSTPDHPAIPMLSNMPNNASPEAIAAMQAELGIEAGNNMDMDWAAFQQGFDTNTTTADVMANILGQQTSAAAMPPGAGNMPPVPPMPPVAGGAMAMPPSGPGFPNSKANAFWTRLAPDLPGRSMLNKTTIALGGLAMGDINTDDPNSVQGAMSSRFARAATLAGQSQLSLEEARELKRTGKYIKTVGKGLGMAGQVWRTAHRAAWGVAQEVAEQKYGYDGSTRFSQWMAETKKNDFGAYKNLYREARNLAVERGALTEQWGSADDPTGERTYGWAEKILDDYGYLKHDPSQYDINEKTGTAYDYGSGQTVPADSINTPFENLDAMFQGGSLEARAEGVITSGQKSDKPPKMVTESQRDAALKAAGILAPQGGHATLQAELATLTSAMGQGKLGTDQSKRFKAIANSLRGYFKSAGLAVASQAGGNNDPMAAAITGLNVNAGDAYGAYQQMFGSDINGQATGNPALLQQFMQNQQQAGVAKTPENDRAGMRKFGTDQSVATLQAQVGSLDGVNKNLTDIAKSFLGLSDAAGKASTSTGRLTEEQMKSVDVSAKMYASLTSTLRDAEDMVKQGGAGGAMAQAVLDRHANVWQNGEAIGGLARTEDRLFGRADATGARGGGLYNRMLAQKYEGLGDMDVEPDFREKLAPFMAGGRSGYNARKEARANGWYGQDGSLGRLAWEVGGSALSTLNSSVMGYRMFRNIAQETVGPLQQAAELYGKTDTSQIQQLQAAGMGSLYQPTSRQDARTQISNAQLAQQLSIGKMFEGTWQPLVGSLAQVGTGGFLGELASIGGPALAAGMGVGFATKSPTAGLVAGGTAAALGVAGMIHTAATDRSTRMDLLGSDAWSHPIENVGTVLAGLADPNQKQADYAAIFAAQSASRGQTGLASNWMQSSSLNAGLYTIGPDGKPKYGSEMMQRITQGYISEHGELLGQYDATAQFAGTVQAEAIFGGIPEDRLRGRGARGGAAGNDYANFGNVAQLFAAGKQYGFDAAGIMGGVAFAQGGPQASTYGSKAYQTAATAVTGLSIAQQQQLGFFSGQAQSTQQQQYAAGQQIVNPLDLLNQFTANPGSMRDILGGIQQSGAWAQYGIDYQSQFNDSTKGDLWGNILNSVRTSDPAQFQRLLGRTGMKAGMTNQLQLGRGMDTTSAGNMGASYVLNAGEMSTGNMQQGWNYLNNINAFDQTQSSGDINHIGLSYATLQMRGLDPEALAQARAQMAGKGTSDDAAMYQYRVNAINQMNGMTGTAGKNLTVATAYAGSYNAFARQTGLTSTNEQTFMGLNTEQQQGILQGAQMFGGMANAGLGFNDQSSAAFQGVRRAELSGDYALANRIGRQAQGAFNTYAGYTRYGNANPATMQAFDSFAANASGQDFAFGMAVVGGDPIANSIAADRGMVGNNRRLVQTGSRGGSLGMQAGYDERITGDIASQRAGIASSQRMVTGNSLYSGSQLSSMNQVQLTTAMNAEQYKVREYDFNLAQVDLNRQVRSTQANWGFEDRGVAQQRAQQDWGFQYQGQQMALQGQQMNYNLNYQQQSMQIQRSHQVSEQQWGLQDMAFQRNVSEVNFGFSMIDADESVRYSRGRERRVAMRHRDEAVVQHSMQMGHLDTEEERAKTRIKWGDEQYKRDEQHFQQDKQFQVQNFQLAQQNYQKQIEFAHEERQLDDEKRRFNRQITQEELTQAQQSLTFHQAEKRAIDDLAGSITAANTLYSQNAAALQYVSTTGQGAITTLGNVAAKLQQLASAPMPSGSGSYAGTGGATVVPSGGALVAGADGQWHVQSTYNSPTITQQPMGITAVSHPDGTTSYHGFAEGGYTGSGSKYQAAGTVHKGEYVIPQAGAPVVMSPEQTELLKEIRDLLKVIHSEGANAIIMVPDSKPGKAISTISNMYDKTWSQ